MSHLVLVESPTKVRDIAKYLGPGWVVDSTVGHIRDLPVDGLGVDLNTFQPTYVPDPKKAEIIAKLRRLVRGAESVYLATDADREGEAIAWHITQLLGIKNGKRVKFREISKSCIQREIQNAGVIDMQLVAAQEGRRVGDRLVGYRVSPLLSEALGEAGLSAGRVQTPAVALVVDREREIRNFTERHHYGVRLSFESGGAKWSADWHTKPLLPKNEKLFTDRAFAEKVSQLRQVTVLGCEDGVASEAPPAPFTSSTLIQAASLLLKFKTKKTMDLAQSLFASGAITYHRTDSPRIDPEKVDEIRALAQRLGLPLPAEPRSFNAKDGAQEAHEAIRPVDINAERAGATPDEQRLYEMIRTRTLASQLADATYSTRTVVMRATAQVEGKPIDFVARGRAPIASGWRTLMKHDDAAERDDEAPLDNPVPQLAKNTQLQATAGELMSKKTGPPKRYTEAGLVKALEEQKVGRPSTYSSIMSKIMKGYIVEEKVGKRDVLKPTPTGEQIVDTLRPFFSFVDVKYTAGNEKILDDVAEGKKKYLDFVVPLNRALDEEIAKFGSALPSMGVVLHDCPTCKAGRLMKRRGQHGPWWGCSGYPSCEARFPDREGAPDFTPRPQKVRDASSPACPSCDAGWLIQREGKHGKWWGCAAFPKCEARFPDRDGAPDFAPRPEKVRAPDAPDCPACKSGWLVCRDGRRGKWWGCARYPKCDAKFDDVGGRPNITAALAFAVTTDTSSRSGGTVTLQAGKKLTRAKSTRTKRK